MAELDSKRPISTSEDLMKGLTKQIYYKRVESINNLIMENKDALNFIGLINPEKGNTCKVEMI